MRFVSVFLFKRKDGDAFCRVQFGLELGSSMQLLTGMVRIDYFWDMRRLFLLVLFATLVGTASAQSDFQIGSIGIERSRIPDEGRSRTVDFAATRLSVPVDMASSEFMFLAYYFSESGELLGNGTPGSFQKIPEKDRVSAGPNGGMVSMPAKLEAGKKYGVKFGAPANIKWKHVIVVAGKKGDLVGKIYPKDDWTKYDFPDKASVRMSQ
ncbi:hypothetical protein [Roseimicrobium sp. ORNL1]|uniref:hypothetical protein n=1 Tax=Roseimicrobium sp. ORNL1 TaxID=2711231 RepID=UPI0013E17EA3|nr:hypothetical protein [Roseimicrobium sp. ORNL1]QIF03146.1 hypothetical protein G5S37_16990 [Roseimicrobium sp. ORNL1]